MTTITQDILNRLHKISIKEYLEKEYGVVFINGTGAFNCRCPHPDHIDRHPSFSTWKNKDGDWFWCCHSCHCGKKDASRHNYGTDIVALIQWLSDFKKSSHILNFKEAVTKAATFIKLNIADKVRQAADFSRQIIRDAVAAGCNKFLLNFKNEAHNYLLSRGLSDEDIKEWQIGYNGDRIVFPLKDCQEKVIGFSMRILKDNPGAPKYVNSRNNEDFNKSSYFYGIHKIAPTVQHLIVTEGQMDVIAAYKYGLKNVVALLGGAFTEQHAEIIKNKFPNITNIILAFDGDEAGERFTDRAADILRAHGLFPNIFKLPENMDLCDFMMIHKAKGAEKILKQFVPVFCNDFAESVVDFQKVIANYQVNLMPRIRMQLSKMRSAEERALFASFCRSNFYLYLNNEYQDTA